MSTARYGNNVLVEACTCMLLTMGVLRLANGHSPMQL